jgi:DNA-binding NarL/FixJ family response regulator
VIRVLLADDQELVRDGFATILDLQSDIEVVGSVADGSQALASTRDLRPDVVLMDVRMPVMDGIEATRRIMSDASTETRVLVLTTFDNDEYVFEALQAGASGFLLKDTPRAGLIAAIRSVALGETLLSPQITHRLVERFARRGPGPDAADSPWRVLSPRELDVALLMARGMSNAEIAADLVLSEATVKTHVAHVLTKTGLRDRVQVVVRAYETGLTEPGGPSAR